MTAIVECRDRQSALGEAMTDLRAAERDARQAQRHIHEAEERICAICSLDEDAIRAIRRANQAVCEHAA